MVTYKGFHGLLDIVKLVTQGIFLLPAVEDVCRVVRIAPRTHAACIPLSVVSSSALMVEKHGSSAESVRATVSQFSTWTELNLGSVKGGGDTWRTLSVLAFFNF